jgi:hypothetical protein
LNYLKIDNTNTNRLYHFYKNDKALKMSIKSMSLFDAINIKFAGQTTTITKKALFDKMKTLIYTYEWFNGKVHACDFAFCPIFKSSNGSTLLLLQNNTMTGTDTYSPQYFLLNTASSWQGARWYYDETMNSIYVQDYVCKNSWNGAGYYKDRIYYDLPDTCDIFVFYSAKIDMIDLQKIIETFTPS